MRNLWIFSVFLVIILFVLWNIDRVKYDKDLEAQHIAETGCNWWQVENGECK